jgi:hypothetical protein
MFENKTFQILANWVSEKTDITIEYADIPQATVNTEKRLISLPNRIKVADPYAATAMLLHEAGHIKYTDNELMNKVVKSPQDKTLHNAMEDVRINRKMFHMLPNVKAFFGELYSGSIPPKGYFDNANNDQELRLRQVFMRVMMYIEGFYEIEEAIPEYKGVDYRDMASLFYKGLEGLDKNDPTMVREAIEEIKKKLNIEDSEENEQGKPNEGEGGEKGEAGEGQDDSAAEEAPEAAEGEGGGEGEEEGETKKSMKSGGDMWGTEHVIEQDTSDKPHELPTRALQELTRQKFCELLKETFKKFIPMGSSININNLTSYHTGNVEGLFRAEVKRKRFNSKVIFLLDQSGSMADNMTGVSNEKWPVMCASLKPVIELIAELKEQEGIAIDFEVWTFDTEIIKKYTVETINELPRARPRGGTNILEGFKEAQESLLVDKEINGRKMIILATDGQVSDDEIKAIEVEILKHNEDVRCMLIGIGAESSGCRSLFERNIISQDIAEDVILAAVSDLL